MATGNNKQWQTITTKVCFDQSNGHLTHAELLIELGAVQTSYHSPKGGDVIRGCDKSVRQGGGVRTMCENKFVTLDI